MVSARLLWPYFRIESFRPDWGESFRPNFKGGSLRSEFRGESYRPGVFIWGMGVRCRVELSDFALIKLK